MATTENGVYYQDDYTKIADILADMEKMAESIDELIEKAKYDDTDVKNNIKTIQDEQKVQNKDIENIQTKDTEQDKLIQKLQANMIQESTEEATSLHVEDASNLPAVLSVRGNHYQEVKNSINELHLIDTPETNLNNGLSYKIEDETIILNGSVESTYALVITTQSNIVDLVKAGEEWTLSAYGENMPAENTFVRITTASNANVLQALLNSTIEEGSNSTTFTENSATVRIMLAANAVYNNSKIKIKLEKGGTKTDYDKYCKMPSIYTPSEIATVKDNIKIIQCNSNFLKKQEAVENVTARGLTGQVLEDGTIILNGTTTGATYIQLTDELKITTYANSQNFEKHTLPNGNYKFISETSGQVSANDIHAYLYDVDKESFLNGIYIQKISEKAKKETTFEISEKWRYYAYVWIKAGTTLTNFTMKFMLKRADDNSDYVQNEQKEYNLTVQQEMLKNDKFNLLSNKEMQTWGYVNTKNVTNLAVSLNYSNGDFRRYSVDLKINDRKTGEYLKMLCTHFKYTDSRWHEYEGICGWESGQAFCIGTFNKELDTAEKMKNYLLNNDVEIYYELAEQEELDLTEEQKETLAQLDNLDLFKGVNNIYTEQNLALLQLEYTADTKMYIDNKIANLKEQVNTTNELLSTTGTSAMLLDNLQNDLESEVM